MALTRYLFASDLHASDLAFRKFISVAIQYHVDVAITDELTGKFIIPAIREKDGSVRFMFRDETVVAKNDAECKTEENKAANVGNYVYYCTPEEMEEVKSKPEVMDELFKKVVSERLRNWTRLAEEKMKGKVNTVILMPGNDDEPYVDDVLAESDWVLNPDNKVVTLGGNEVLATGLANMTPWKCPRDVEEEVLEKHLIDLSAQVKDWKHAIVLTHCPPYDTKLDMAPKLDSKFNVVYAGGTPVMLPVGSTSVRKMIEKYQPLLGLHGHIHESKGIDHIGRTTVINSGSEYFKGLLSAALVNLEDDRIKGYMFLVT
ncbi:MAG: metallophosphoesterase family protein [Candidatus Bathyarchaeia archaeon]